MACLRSSTSVAALVLLLLSAAGAQPVLVQTSPAHGGAILTLTVTSATPFAEQLLGISFGHVEPPLSLGPLGLLALAAPISILSLGAANAAGSTTLSIPLAPEPAIVGLLLHAQVLDLGATLLSTPKSVWFGPPGILDSTNPQGGIVGGVFGWSVAIGDFAGTSAPDLAIGAPGETIGGATSAGRVYVFPGPHPFTAPPIVLASPSPAIGARFGRALVRADFDGDGLDDLAVGEPGFDAALGNVDAGRVIVFLHPAGSGGSVSLAPPLLQPYEQLGMALAAGDLDADLKDDVATGGGEGPSNQPRRVVVFSHAGATIVAASIGDPGGGAPQSFAFGGALAIGNVDASPAPEIVVTDRTWLAAGGTTGYGRAWLFSPSGILLATLPNPSPTVFASGFGQSVAIGDVTGDGLGDILIGALGQNRALLHPAPTFASPIPLPVVRAADLHGGRAVLVADIDGDGHQDAILAASSCAAATSPCGGLSFYLGPSLLCKGFMSPAATSFALAAGWNLAAGDVDQNGIADIVAGDPFANPAFNPGQGRAHLFR